MSLRLLVLLRHGQTGHNIEGRMQGHLDSRLTEAGRAQALAVAPVMARLAPDRILSSDLSRAADTADAVAAACGLPVTHDARLRETHLGQWQGRTVTEIEQDWPGAIATWRSDPTCAPPGGESRVQVVRRVLPVVEELDDAPDDVSDRPTGGLSSDASDGAAESGPQRTTLLVAHGGLIAGLVCGLLALPTSAWPQIGGLGNCRWAVLARRADHPRWRLTGYNVGVDELAGGHGHVGPGAR